MDGQLWPAERQFLHDAVVSARPNIVLEVGTWKGGGSTWQIATALKELKHGHLHTCEINSDFYIEAKKIYDNDEWRPYVTCWNTPSKSLIDHMKTSGDIPDFIFFDGPDDPQHALTDLQVLMPHLKSRTLFCMHDWDLGKRADGLISNKATLIRPYIEGSHHWNIIKSLTAPESVGIVLAQRT